MWLILLHEFLESICPIINTPLPIYLRLSLTGLIFSFLKFSIFFKKLFWVGLVWIVQYGNNTSNFICLSIVFSIWYLEVKILGSDSEQEEGVLGWNQDFTVPREPLCVLPCENGVRRQDLKDRIWTLFSLNLLAFWSCTSQRSEIWEIPFCYKELSGWCSFVAAV